MEPERPLPNLSPREQELIKFAAEGLTDTAISHKLGISEATVGTYWGRVRIKLGPYSRTELVAITMRAEREAAVENLRLENQHLLQELRAQSSLGGTFYRDLVENAPDAILLVHADGKIFCGNAAALALFGYQKDELHGKDLSNLIPPTVRGKHRGHVAEYVQDPHRRPMGAHLETPAFHKSGASFPIHASLSAITTPSGIIVMCAIRPIDMDSQGRIVPPSSA